MPGALPADAPTWRRHTHADGYAYGWLLLLIGVSLTFQLAAGDSAWARIVTLIIQSVTLLAALTISGAHRWVIHLAILVSAIGILGALGLLIGSGEVDEGAARL